VTKETNNSRPDGKTAKYVLSDPTLLRWVLRNCGAYLQNPARRAQAKVLAEALGIELPPQQPPTYAWALGLFETDGSLGLYPSGGASYRLRVSVAVGEEALALALRFLFGGSFR